MSEARNQRFEIDIDEIERQLRRSVEAAPPARQDPLAELARIVGQDDPFRGILGHGRDGVSNVHAFDRSPTPELVADRYGQGYSAHGGAHHTDELFDPVNEAYGSLDDAIDSEDIQPLRPRRSRGRLAGVAALLLVTALAGGGAFYWRKAGSSFMASANPPVITADKTPLKVAPENPGGVEVPNQNRQIYDRAAPDGQSRVVDGREQPLDVREAARTMPSTGISARAPVPSSDAGDAPRPPSDVVAVSTPGGRNAVTNALGEPRLVRTSSVRPDGTPYSPTTTASAADPAPSLIPSSLPPPVPVATVPVSGRTGAAGTNAISPPAVAESPAPTGSPVTVLPPARPKIDRRAAEPAAEAPVRVATATTEKPATPTARAAATEKPAAEKPSTSARKYSVQIAVKPTDEEARSAYAQLQDKFVADLDGRSAQVTKAEVKGKTVHRVRVGPMSKEDADGLCSRLKSSGGSCFVATN